eukprot:5751483-Amphidinium_carterae.1
MLVAALGGIQGRGLSTLYFNVAGKYYQGGESSSHARIKTKTVPREKDRDNPFFMSKVQT